MSAPDAIAVLSASVVLDSGRWRSTRLSSEDNLAGAPGGELRVRATALLGMRYPNALIVATGARGYDVVGQEDRPLLCDILQAELVAAGIALSRVVREDSSNTTYQQLVELHKLAQARGWQSVYIVSSRWHLPRIRAMLEAKLPAFAPELCAAEDILVEADPNQKGEIDAAYASEWLRERIAKEEQGIAHIQSGTYRF